MIFAFPKSVKFSIRDFYALYMAEFYYCIVNGRYLKRFFMPIKIKGFKIFEGASPDVSFLPMLARRKLDLTGKIVFHLANALAGGKSGYKSVFASRYGCLNDCIKLFDSLNSGMGVSPNGFSSSVHNFPMGMFSIVEKNKSPYTAIAAGENSLEAGLLEAFLETSEVLFVYAQEPLLDVIDGESAPPCGLAFYCENCESGEICVEFGNFSEEPMSFEKLKCFFENGGEICGKFLKLKSTL